MTAHFSVKRDREYAAFAGLVDGRQMSEISVRGRIYFKYSE